MRPRCPTLAVPLRDLVTAEPEDAEHRAQLREAASAIAWDFVEVSGFSLWQEGSGALCVLAPPKKGGDVAALCQILKARLKATERFEYQVIHYKYPCA